MIFLAFLFLVDILYPLIRYAPGQIINPVRFVYYLALSGFFFFIVWETPTLSGSLTWLTLLLTIDDLGYIVIFLSNVIILPMFHGLGYWSAMPVLEDA